jgi:hypothetical protein
MVTQSSTVTKKYTKDKIVRHISSHAERLPLLLNSHLDNLENNGYRRPFLNRTNFRKVASKTGEQVVP